MSVLNSSAPIFNVKIKNYEIEGLCKGDGLQKAWVGAVMLQKDPQLRKCETYENAVNQDTDLKLLSRSFTIDASLWNKR